MKKIVVVRYGAFGDMIQVSSILPGLKRQGWHITMNVDRRGMDVLKHDPNVDAWLPHETNSVPVEDLPRHWQEMAKNYDRMLNLSESVEGTWLAIPGRPNFAWPHKVRAKYLDGNYLEFLHDLAGVSLPPEQKFYPTLEEKRWANKQRMKMGGKKTFVIVWSLSGSARHKVYPWTDNVVATLLDNCPNVRVVFVGGPECAILEQGWEKDKRVHLRSGEWSIRKTFAFLEQCDMVVGPETGVLNAAGMLDIPKVVMLSHSSPNNLTKHWKNTVNLIPAGVDCYPCHRMHYGMDYCKQHTSRAALCAAAISVEQAYRAILPFVDAHAMERAA